MPPLKPFARMKISASRPNSRKFSAVAVSSPPPRCALDRPQQRAALVLFHDRLQRRRIQPGDRRQPLGDELAMAAVAAEDVVVGLQRQRRADRRAFLADREMRRPLVDVVDPGIAALRLEGAEHRLEFADDHHVAQHAQQRCIAVALPFFGQWRRIGVNRDIGELQPGGLAHQQGIDKELFGHREIHCLRHMYFAMNKSTMRVEIDIRVSSRHRQCPTMRIMIADPVAPRHRNDRRDPGKPGRWTADHRSRGACRQLARSRRRGPRAPSPPPWSRATAMASASNRRSAPSRRPAAGPSSSRCPRKASASAPSCPTRPSISSTACSKARPPPMPTPAFARCSPRCRKSRNGRPSAAANPTAQAALHVDTGMNRMGLTLAEAEALLAEPGLAETLGLTLVMSHLACADTPGHPLNQRQLAAFREVRARLPGRPGIAGQFGRRLPRPRLPFRSRPAGHRALRRRRRQRHRQPDAAGGDAGSPHPPGSRRRARRNGRLWRDRSARAAEPARHPRRRLCRRLSPPRQFLRPAPRRPRLPARPRRPRSSAASRWT